MDGARLIDKLRLVEALFAGAATEGEKVAGAGSGPEPVNPAVSTSREQQVRHPGQVTGRTVSTGHYKGKRK